MGRVVEAEWPRRLATRLIALAGSVYCTVFLAVFSIAMKIVHYQPAFSADSGRYWRQSDSIMAGTGFANGYGDGVLDVALPPVYPLFLVLLRSVHDSADLVRIIQVGLSLATLVVLYLALNAASRAWANLGLLMVGGSNLVNAAMGSVLSETLGLFITSLVVLFLMDDRLQSKRWTPWMLGVLLMALVLNSPAVGVMAGLVFIGQVVAYASWRQRILLALGCLTLAIPWQIHCLRATGRVLPLIYEAREENILDRGTTQWARTWLTRPSEVPFAWYHKLEELPDDLFINEDERPQLSAMAGKAPPLSPEFQAPFKEFAAKRVEMSAWTYRWRPLILRYVNLWKEVPDAMPAQRSYFGRVGPGAWAQDRALGAKRALLRQLKGLYSTFSLGLYGVCTLGLLACAVRALTSRRLMPALIIIGVLGYSLFMANSGLVEVRRNVVFYPMIVCAAALPALYQRRARGEEDALAPRPS